MIGQRVRSKKQSYYMRSEGKTRTVWHTLIEWNDEFVYISDKTTESKLMEASSAIEARQMAIKIRDEQNTRLLEEQA